MVDVLDKLVLAAAARWRASHQLLFSAAQLQALTVALCELNACEHLVSVRGSASQALVALAALACMVRCYLINGKCTPFLFDGSTS